MSDERTSHPAEERKKKLPHGGLAVQLGSCACESCCKSNKEHAYQRVSNG